MIIAISGRTASGKTTLAKALVEEFGGTTGSFGDYVRKLASDHGRSLDRASLQDVGQAAIDAGAPAFVEKFLAELGGAPDGTLVLEGLRHVAVRDALRSHAQTRRTEIRFVHIETDEQQRAARLRARGGSEFMTAMHDAHASESDVRERLRDEADLVVHRGDDVLAMVEEVRRGLSLQGKRERGRE